MKQKKQNRADINELSRTGIQKQSRMNIADYTIEREFLGSITTAELLSRIIRAHLSDSFCQETKLP